jgi:hypothetical protein
LAHISANLRELKPIGKGKGGYELGPSLPGSNPFARDCTRIHMNLAQFQCKFPLDGNRSDKNKLN